MSTSRIRFLDRRVLANSTLQLQTYSRLTCSGTLEWRNSGSPVVGSKYIGDYSSMVDTVVPNYHKRSAKGAVFMNPLEHNRISLSSGSYTPPEQESISTTCTGVNLYKARQKWTVTSGDYGAVSSPFRINLADDGRLIAPASLMSDDIALAQSEVITRVLAMRGAGLSNSNLWESLTELNKSALMLRDVLISARKFLSTRKGVGALERAQAASDAYLLYRYGFKPFVSDIVMIINGMNKTVGQLRQSTRSRLTLNKTSVSSSSWNTLSGVNATDQAFWSETADISALSLDDMLATWADIYGLTAKNLLMLPWEKQSLSFVADWFVNIGDLLGALIPSPKLHQLGMCVVVRRSLYGTYSIPYSKANSGYTVITSPQAHHSMNFYGVSRTVGVSGPSLLIKRDFRFTNVNRTLDALALVLQRVRT